MLAARFRSQMLAVLLIIGLALSLPAAVMAEGEIPRTASGRPDLSGSYDPATLTLLERPAEYGDKLFMTRDQAEKIAADQEVILDKRIVQTEDQVILITNFHPQAGLRGGSQNTHVVERLTELESLSLEELLQVQLIPVDVHGTHIHQKDEWMVGYQFRFMEMSGNRDGEQRLSLAEVLAGFPVTPTRMTVQTSVAEVMYGLTDRVTLMAMIPHHRKKMEHVTRSGVRFTTLSEGVGDIMLGTHLLVKKRGPHWWIVSPHLSLPTGSIDERGATPAGADQKLPYPMQLGSGSVDFIPEVNYLWQTKESLLGASARVRLSLDENDNGYRVGDRYHLNVFLSRRLSRRWAASARVEGKWSSNYSGADPDLDPAAVHTADPRRRGGRLIQTLLGVNFFGRGEQENLSTANGHRFAFELGVPVHQSLDGPQLEIDWTGHFAWRWTF